MPEAAAVCSCQMRLLSVLGCLDHQSWLPCARLTHMHMRHVRLHAASPVPELTCVRADIRRVFRQLLRRARSPGLPGQLANPFTDGDAHS